MADDKRTARLAQLEDRQVLVSILSDAFQHDPVVRWILPSEEFDANFFDIDVGYAYLGHHHCWIGGLNEAGKSDDSAAACWLPPDKKPLRAPLIQTLKVIVPMLLKFGFSAAKRGSVVEQAFAHYRPKAPHYYLHMLGARQSHQGKGLGSMLLVQGLREVDQHVMPAYLESSNEANVSLYERFGFQVQHEVQLGGGGPTIWYMWRDRQ